MKSVLHCFHSQLHGTKSSYRGCWLLKIKQTEWLDLYKLSIIACYVMFPLTFRCKFWAKLWSWIQIFMMETEFSLKLTNLFLFTSWNITPNFKSSRRRASVKTEYIFNSDVPIWRVNLLGWPTCEQLSQWSQQFSSLYLKAQRVS
jgi:hypothetical protein